jgi:3-isopropylmalate/(R)-2-methylmalate dehydratase large subunit
MALTTLFDKIWDAHVVRQIDERNSLVYIDRHLLHEANTPHAFEGLSQAGLEVRRPMLTLGTADHVVPTQPGAGVTDPEAKVFLRLFDENCRTHGITGFSMGDRRQGIVHVIGPEQGFTLPGATVVCGDSHTSTHGAFGAWAFGIGISEVEHVLATQTLVQQRPRNMRVTVCGTLSPAVHSKDVVLALIGRIGTAGGTGHVIEFAGDAMQRMSMEARMTMCNMAIEAGARAGLVAPDEVTFGYLRGRPMAPSGREWDMAVQAWRQLRSDPQARFDQEVHLDASAIEPHVTWGTSPQDVAPITATVPDPGAVAEPARRQAMERALNYMGLRPGMRLTDIPIDRVFIGSCTNSRIEDLRIAASVIGRRKVARGVRAWIVPGSQAVKLQAESEGLRDLFVASGFEWREPGCSMCLGMNEDRLEPGERCASTSNRNFEGRQGRGGRTHLLSPAMAAAAAIVGRLVDARTLM